MDSVSPSVVFDFSSLFSGLGDQLGSLLVFAFGIGAGVLASFMILGVVRRASFAMSPETFEARQARGKREVEKIKKRAESYDVAARQGFFTTLFDKRRGKTESVQEFRDRMRNNSEIQLRRSERLELQLLVAFNKHRREEVAAEKKAREEYRLSLALPDGRVIWGTHFEPPVLPDEKFEKAESWESSPSSSSSSSSSPKPQYEDWVA
ncbi:MAG: hypothetical protein ACRC46_13295 [Thermoguttaceae bacterium]